MATVEGRLIRAMETCTPFDDTVVRGGSITAATIVAPSLKPRWGAIQSRNFDNPVTELRVKSAVLNPMLQIAKPVTVWETAGNVRHQFQ